MNIALHFPSLVRSTQRPDSVRELSLESKGVLTLRLRAGARLSAETGRIWLTEPGDLNDHFVGPSQSYTVKRGGWIVVECDSANSARLSVAK